MTEAEMQELEDMVALRDARRLSWLLTTTAGAAVRVRMARRRGDGKTPSSPAEVTTLGTPQINPTPRALFPGSPTPRKGLGITFCEGVRRRKPPATVDGASPEGPLKARSHAQTLADRPNCCAQASSRLLRFRALADGGPGFDLLVKRVQRRCEALAVGAGLCEQVQEVRVFHPQQLVLGLHLRGQSLEL